MSIPLTRMAAMVDVANANGDKAMTDLLIAHSEVVTAVKSLLDEVGDPTLSMATWKHLEGLAEAAGLERTTEGPRAGVWEFRHDDSPEDVPL